MRENQSCRDTAALLVPFADGELGPAEAAQVQRHLDQCPACRWERELLDRSLAVAREIWELSAAGAKPPPIPTRSRRHSSLAVAAVAAALVALCVTLGYRLVRPSSPQGDMAPPDAISAPDAVPPRPAAEGGGEFEDIKALVARRARAARLAVAVELLASQPGLEEYHRRAQEYLRNTYPATESGAGIPEARP